MTYQEIRDLTEWLEKSSFTSYSLTVNGVSLSTSKQNTTTSQPIAPLPLPISDTAPAPIPVTYTPEPVKENSNDHVITSPIVGTFYASANPESAEFVTVGQSVKQGDTLCILEAMKVMNEITSDVDGTVTEILVSNGAMVEARMPLFKIAR